MSNILEQPTIFGRKLLYFVQGLTASLTLRANYEGGDKSRHYKN